MTTKKNIKNSRTPSTGRRARPRVQVSEAQSVRAGNKNRAAGYVFSIVLLLVVVILSLGLFYLYRVNQSLRQPEVQKQLAQQANQKLLDKVAGIILVPTGEDPTVAKIVNVSNLKKTNPAFYEFAQDGDHLIIYSSKAIIYREAENKIINVAPVVIKPGDQPGLKKSSDNSTDNFGSGGTDSTSNSNSAAN